MLVPLLLPARLDDSVLSSGHGSSSLDGDEGGEPLDVPAFPSFSSLLLPLAREAPALPSGGLCLTEGFMSTSPGNLHLASSAWYESFVAQLEQPQPWFCDCK